MEPSLNSNGNKPVKVSFKVKENHSNWLAVGICYKNAVADSNYNFNYSTLGHGAYLVSCNAGTFILIQVLGLLSTHLRIIKLMHSTIM